MATTRRKATYTQVENTQTHYGGRTLVEQIAMKSGGGKLVKG
jgi:hypothetical protein